MSNDSNNFRKLGFLGVLQVIFIILKLFGLIKWRWLYVLAPLYMSIGFIFVALLILLGVYLWEERKN